MKKIVSVGFVLLIASTCVSQSNPSFRQFYFNPSYVNPAYTSIDGYSEVYFASRKQWINFKDAPSFSQLQVQLPTRGRVALGFSISNQQVVALQNTFVSAAFAYRIPFALNKSLIFALSGGVGTGNLDLDGFDYSSDPTVLNAAANSFYGNGSFGMVYEWNRLRLGFGLPQLLGQQYFSPQRLGNVDYSQLLKQNYSISYKFFSGPISVEPWFLFRLNSDNQNSWDGGAKIGFYERVWLGSSYSAQQGTAFFVGLNVKEKLKVGYSYEIPAAASGLISTSSMELQVRVRIGAKREFRWASKFKQQETEVAKSEVEEAKDVSQKLDQPSLQPQLTPKPEANIVTRPVVPKDTTTIQEKKPIAPFVEKKPEFKSERKAGVETGFYLVAGSFKSLTNAMKFKTDLKNKGFAKADYIFNAVTGLYNVYVFYSQSKEVVLGVLLKFQDSDFKFYIREVK